MTMIHSWPEAILHCDADAFYVGCELARRPGLRGQPTVVTGRLGACVLAKSYDLKQVGVKTAMPVWEVKRLCPQVNILEADFHYYSEMSSKMINIFKRWTPEVEVYSIDEAFLDIKGFRRLYKMSYRDIAATLQKEVMQQLGLSISIGLSVNKTLAKMASESNKPYGLTVVSWRDINTFLYQRSLSEIPGFGRNTLPLMAKLSIHYCHQFQNLTLHSVKGVLNRPGVELWQELGGKKIFPVQASYKPAKGIIRSSSFKPLTSNQHFLWAHTVRQLERSIDALHEDQQRTAQLTLYLRDNEFRRYSWVQRLKSSTKSFDILLDTLKELWKQYFPQGKTFRSTGVCLGLLSSDTGVQMNLFENPVRLIRKDELEDAKVVIKDRYGNNSVRAASSLRLSDLGPNKKKAIRAKAFNVDW